MECQLPHRHPRSLFRNKTWTCRYDSPRTVRFPGKRAKMTLIQRLVVEFQMYLSRTMSKDLVSNLIQQLEVEFISTKKLCKILPPLNRKVTVCLTISIKVQLPNRRSTRPTEQMQSRKKMILVKGEKILSRMHPSFLLM